MNTVLLVLASLAFLFWALSSYLIWKQQDENIFPGDGRPFGQHPELADWGGKALSAERDGIPLRWYFFEAPQAKAALILFHGNRDGAFERLDFVKELLPTGVSVALIEYPGYAGDPQRLDEWHFLRSSLAAYDEIESRSKLPLFVMGESLGTGAATYCASMRKPKGLLLSTPYTSMAAVAKHRYPWVPIFKLIRHPIYAEQWAPHVLCPVLILHGTEDKTVPYALGQAQAKNFKTLESFVTVPGAGHANLRGFPGGAFWEACRAFLLKHA